MKIRIGLLLCDHVPEGLLASFGDYPEMYQKAFNGLGFQISWIVYDACKTELPNTTGEVDGFIISGSRFSVNDNEKWITNLISFVRWLNQEKIPTVGICFGHQLIAKALGGVVEKSGSGWGVGCKAFLVDGKRDWMKGSKEELVVPAFHQEQITRLPIGGRLIGSADYCTNFLMECNDQMLGIQGHPEFRKEYISALLGERLAVLSEAVSSEAEKSLKLSEDNTLIKSWILDFIRIRAQLL